MIFRNKKKFGLLLQKDFRIKFLKSFFFSINKELIINILKISPNIMY